MADSEDKPQAESKNLPPGVTAIVIANRYNKPYVVHKGEGGRFIPKMKSLPSVAENIRKRRKIFNKFVPGTSVTEDEALFERILAITRMEIGTDPKTGFLDSKMAAVIVKAAELAVVLAHGKMPASEIDTEKQTKQQVSTVVIVSPTDVKPMEPKPEENTQPSWAEITSITTNKK